MTREDLWRRYCRYHCACGDLGLTLDVSRMRFADDLFERHRERMTAALAFMQELEDGAIANHDEQRMVGHYWLRAPQLAPQAELGDAVRDCLASIKSFAADVRSGKIAPPSGGRFENVLVIGIGGSALGPQFVDDALSNPGDPMRLFFFDNTDPDGIDRTVARLGPGLSRTLSVVISKSGGTKETRNGMLEAAEAYRRAGLEFAKHAVAITSDGSALDRTRSEQGWIAAFPMWDWVGGRTSQTSAVGLLPAALQGFDVDKLLAGAAEMDAVNRRKDVAQNPAALMALNWLHAAEARNLRDMVIIPYKDRLALLSRYLQQLVMESIGKECDLDGNVVHEGITVYGNKGSTDQHAYVQQLREGLHNFYVTFIEVLSDRPGDAIEVEPGITSGDYLSGFLLGTREALYENDRESMTITVDAVTPRTVGALIALFERAVGIYAALVNVNAYHQPGVEAGKKAAGRVIELQDKALAHLRQAPGEALTAAALAKAIGEPDQAEWVYLVLRHLSANPSRNVVRNGGAKPEEATFSARR